MNRGVFVIKIWIFLFVNLNCFDFLCLCKIDFFFEKKKGIVILEEIIKEFLVIF